MANYRLRNQDNEKIVAIGECSNGNESVGNMWEETEIFTPETTLRELLNWASDKSVSGNLKITIPTSSQ